jgi:hypothetical protein
MDMPRILAQFSKLRKNSDSGGVGKGTTFSRAVSRPECVHASAPEVSFHSRREFFRSPFSRAVCEA